MHAVKMSIFIM